MPKRERMWLSNMTHQKYVSHLNDQLPYCGATCTGHQYLGAPIIEFLETMSTKVISS